MRGSDMIKTSESPCSTQREIISPLRCVLCNTKLQSSQHREKHVKESARSSSQNLFSFRLWSAYTISWKKKVHFLQSRSHTFFNHSGIRLTLPHIQGILFIISEVFLGHKTQSIKYNEEVLPFLTLNFTPLVQWADAERYNKEMEILTSARCWERNNNTSIQGKTWWCSDHQPCTPTQYIVTAAIHRSGHKSTDILNKMSPASYCNDIAITGDFVHLMVFWNWIYFYPQIKG